MDNIIWPNIILCLLMISKEPNAILIPYKTQKNFEDFNKYQRY